MNNIIFLGHDVARDEETRRQIRARAAEYSHRIGPRKPKASKKSAKAGAKRPQADEEKDKESGGKPYFPRRGSSSWSVTSTATFATWEARDVSEAAEDWEAITPTTTLPSPIPRLGGYADELFDAYPVPYQPWYPEVLDYMWHFMLRGWEVLYTTPSQRAEALLWVQQLTMQDPTYFYMNMLSVTGDLVSQGRQDARFVVWLTGEVVASINKALGDPKRALSVGTILAVGRLALREIVVGDVVAGSTFHRPAFARMIVMAGGLRKLGLPSLVREHLAWADRLVTRKTGVRIGEIEPDLEKEFASRRGGTERDAKADMKVLDAYLPFRSRTTGEREKGGGKEKGGKRVEEGGQPASREDDG